MSQDWQTIAEELYEDNTASSMTLMQMVEDICKIEDLVPSSELASRIWDLRNRKGWTDVVNDTQYGMPEVWQRNALLILV